MHTTTHNTWQENEREARSVELANEHGFSAGAARFYVGTRDGLEVYRALSERTHTYDYSVTYDPASDRVLACTCPAGANGHACKHVGAVRAHVERGKRMAAAAEAAEAKREAHEARIRADLRTALQRSDAAMLATKLATKLAKVLGEPEEDIAECERVWKARSAQVVRLIAELAEVRRAA